MPDTRATLVLRILLPVTAIVAAMTALLGGFCAHMLESEIRNNAAQQVGEQQSRVLDTLETANVLSGQAVRAAMRVLMREGASVGEPSLGAPVRMGDRTVPELRLGSVSQNGNFRLVDDVTSMMGGTATLFVRSGESFVRVSTNVPRPGGGRAVGTSLAPAGRAYAAIRAGHAFYGVVDILGKPYMTAYEPMRNRAGEVVGIWYVGYPLAMLAGLGEHISGERILDRGFLALVRDDGAMVFGPSAVAAPLVQRVLRGEARGWTVSEVEVGDWQYHLATAWPESDVSRRLMKMKALVAGCTLLIAVLLAAVVWVILRRRVVAPVRELTRRLENADLNTLLRERRKDEIGRLAGAFDQFVLRVRGVLMEVSEVSGKLNHAATEIAASAAVQAEGALQESKQTSQVVLALNEISSAATQVSAGSEEASTAARQTVDLAHEGRTAALQSETAMKKLAAAVEGSAQQIAGLEAQSGRIGRAITVINDIAERTNLLALNAAIEAARAGESGRGFAVVAGEVRRLAERTTEATKEIGEVVRAIQEETRRTVEAVSQNRDAAGEESRLAGETGAHLERITDMARQSGAMIVQIAAAATEQAAHVAVIQENVDRIARLEENTSSEAGRSAEECGRLSSLAETLSKLVEQFHLHVENSDAARRKESARRAA